MRAKEIKLKRKVRALLSDDGIAWTVRECIYKHEEEPDCLITQRKMTAAVSECRSGVWHHSKAVRWWREKFDAKVPRDLAEKVAKLQISSLIECGVVRREGIRGVEALYAVDPSRAKEIIDDHDALFFEHNLL